MNEADCYYRHSNCEGEYNILQEYSSLHCTALELWPPLHLVAVAFGAAIPIIIDVRVYEHVYVPFLYQHT